MRKLNDLNNTKFVMFQQKITNIFKKIKIKYISFSKKFEKQYIEKKKWFRVEKYQRENVEKLCNVFEINYDNLNITFRITKMFFSQSFKIWQIVDIYILIEFYYNEFIRDCILKNEIDLNKTWIIVKFLLVVNIVHFLTFSFIVYMNFLTNIDFLQ